MTEQHNEKLFNEWWRTTAPPRLAADLLIGMKDWNPEGIKALAKAAFLAGRQTMMPIPTEEADMELTLTTPNVVDILADRDYHDGI